jgi:hypothetical protein
MAVLLSRRLVAQGHDRAILRDDWGKVAFDIDKLPYDKRHVSLSAQIVARLHVRGKSNEAHARNLRSPVDEDAEFALTPWALRCEMLAGLSET